MIRRKVAKGHCGVAIWVATGFGSGYFPVAPGTAGSAVGLALVIAISRIQSKFPWPGPSLAILAALLFAVGVWSAGKAEKAFGRVDPGEVVIDEIVGQIITFLATPKVSWIWLLAGFFLFRAFDIVKPFPARRAERLPGGWGIMLDDVIAGLYALIVLVVLGRVIK